jgi:hypothetical protein
MSTQRPEVLHAHKRIVALMQELNAETPGLRLVANLSYADPATDVVSSCTTITGLTDAGEASELLVDSVLAIARKVGIVTPELLAWLHKYIAHSEVNVTDSDGVSYNPTKLN